MKYLALGLLALLIMGGCEDRRSPKPVVIDLVAGGEGVVFALGEQEGVKATWISSSQPAGVMASLSEQSQAIHLMDGHHEGCNYNLLKIIESGKVSDVVMGVLPTEPKTVDLYVNANHVIRIRAELMAREENREGLLLEPGFYHYRLDAGGYTLIKEFEYPGDKVLGMLFPNQSRTINDLKASSDSMFYVMSVFGELGARNVYETKSDEVIGRIIDAAGEIEYQKGLGVGASGTSMVVFVDSDEKAIAYISFGNGIVDDPAGLGTYMDGGNRFEEVVRQLADEGGLMRTEKSPKEMEAIFQGVY